MNDQLPEEIVYTDGVTLNGEKVWFLTRCPSSECKEMWYFSHEVDNVAHNEDNTHSIEYQGIAFEQNNFNYI